MAGKKRARTKNSNNRAGKFCISLIMIAFVAVMSVQIVKIYQKDQEYIDRQAALEREYAEEMGRKNEIKEYDRYTQSREYVEDIAKSKLGLLYGNEIIFKEQKE